MSKSEVKKDLGRVLRTFWPLSIRDKGIMAQAMARIAGKLVSYVNGTYGKFFLIKMDKNKPDPFPDKALLMAKATTLALGIVLLTLALVFVTLILIK